LSAAVDALDRLGRILRFGRYPHTVKLLPPTQWRPFTGAERPAI